MVGSHQVSHEKFTQLFGWASLRGVDDSDGSCQTVASIRSADADAIAFMSADSFSAFGSLAYCMSSGSEKILSAGAISSFFSASGGDEETTRRGRAMRRRSIFFTSR